MRWVRQFVLALLGWVDSLGGPVTSMPMHHARPPPPHKPITHDGLACALRTLRSQLELRSRLEGLRSRCRTLAECMYLSARSTCALGVGWWLRLGWVR